ncbi:hypothetical protein VVATL9824_02327 [Vibrio vulnificus]|nr:hypothetical protein VVATL9824_02327 [Vibrio vulnificus]
MIILVGERQQTCSPRRKTSQNQFVLVNLQLDGQLLSLCAGVGLPCRGDQLACRHIQAELTRLWERDKRLIGNLNLSALRARLHAACRDGERQQQAEDKLSYHGFFS